jgi:hypothetical protein
VLSEARTLEEAVAEIAATRVSECGETLADDGFSEAAMEEARRPRRPPTGRDTSPANAGADAADQGGLRARQPALR